jgi:hypothetical protein
LPVSATYTFPVESTGIRSGELSWPSPKDNGPDESGSIHPVCSEVKSTYYKERVVIKGQYCHGFGGIHADIGAKSRFL